MLLVVNDHDMLGWVMNIAGNMISPISESDGIIRIA
jgi:hypothetical protein